jgi:hypothetical protein
VPFNAAGSGRPPDSSTDALERGCGPLAQPDPGPRDTRTCQTPGERSRRLPCTDFSGSITDRLWTSRSSEMQKSYWRGARAAESDSLLTRVRDSTPTGPCPRVRSHLRCRPLHPRRRLHFGGVYGHDCGRRSSANGDRSTGRTSTSLRRSRRSARRRVCRRCAVSKDQIEPVRGV